MSVRCIWLCESLVKQFRENVLQAVDDTDGRPDASWPFFAPPNTKPTVRSLFTPELQSLGHDIRRRSPDWVDQESVVNMWRCDYQRDCSRDWVCVGCQESSQVKLKGLRCTADAARGYERSARKQFFRDSQHGNFMTRAQVSMCLVSRKDTV